MLRLPIVPVSVTLVVLLLAFDWLELTRFTTGASLTAVIVKLAVAVLKFSLAGPALSLPNKALKAITAEELLVVRPI